MCKHLEQQLHTQLYIAQLLCACIPRLQQWQEHRVPFLPSIRFGDALEEPVVSVMMLVPVKSLIVEETQAADLTAISNFPDW